MHVSIDKGRNSAILELSSVEESHRFLKSERKFLLIILYFLELRILG